MNECQPAGTDTDDPMTELRAACARMGSRNGAEELQTWRAISEARRLQRLEHPHIDAATAEQRGRELLRALDLA